MDPELLAKQRRHIKYLRRTARCEESVAAVIDECNDIEWELNS